MTRDQAQEIATRNNLGIVQFQFNVSRNTSQEFEVGYVFVSGERTLFCKRQPSSAPEMLYLCNEFSSYE